MRTPEQHRADDDLDVAIRALAAAEEDDGGYVVDWLVVYACADPADDERTMYGCAYPGGSMPSYRILGLLEVARDHVLNADDDDDDD